MFLDELYWLAIDLWDEGYRKASETPGILRWHNLSEERDHPQKAVPIEIWFFVRGCHFGIGDYSSSKESK